MTGPIWKILIFKFFECFLEASYRKNIKKFSQILKFFKENNDY